MCLTIQTFSAVLFLSTAIIKLVSDGLVQCLTPGLGGGTPRVFSRLKEMWHVVHMNTPLSYPKGAPLAWDLVPMAMRARFCITPEFMPDLIHLTDICCIPSKCQTLNKTLGTHETYYLFLLRDVRCTREACHVGWQCLLGCAGHRRAARNSRGRICLVWGSRQAPRRWRHEARASKIELSG